MQDGELVKKATVEEMQYIKNWQDDLALLETEYKAKQEARDSAIKKLGEIAGLTKEELNAIL